MSPLFEELTRLALRYDDACRSPFSCPRDREILRTRIADLEDTIKTLRVRAAKAIELSEAEVERLRNNLGELRKTRRELKTTRETRIELKVTRDSSDTAIVDTATLQDAEALVAYTRFLIGMLENRAATKEGMNSEGASLNSHREDPDPDLSCI